MQRAHTVASTTLVLPVIVGIVASVAIASPSATTAGVPPAQQIAALKKQVRVLDGQVRVLKGQVRVLKGQVKDLKGQVKFLSGRVATLQEETALIVQLADIAAATGRYRELGNALTNGYVKVEAPCIQTAGYHYVRGSWPNDSVLDALQPEFLMYAPTNAGMKLVAVEYAVPARFPRPTFLGGRFETYTGGPGEPIWYLHVWLWQLNPAGTFSAFNRTVEC